MEHLCRRASTIHQGALCIPIRSVANATNTTLWRIVLTSQAPKGHYTLREHFLEDTMISSKDRDWKLAVLNADSSRIDLHNSLSEALMRGLMHPQHRPEQETWANGNERRKLQWIAQPQYKVGNVVFHHHSKMYKIYSTTEIALYIPTTAFSRKLHSKRDHTKPHLIWQDTLAPKSVSMAQPAFHHSPFTKSARPEHEQIPKSTTKWIWSPQLNP